MKYLSVQSFRNATASCVGTIGPLVLVLAGGLLGCSQLADSSLHWNFNLARINDIQQKRQLDVEVYLQGKVENRAPFLGTSAYQLQDGTGRLWVLTKEAVPQTGDQLLIKGQVRYMSIPLKELGSQDLGEVYVEELERIKRAEAGESSTPNSSESQTQ